MGKNSDRTFRLFFAISWKWFENYSQQSYRSGLTRLNIDRSREEIFQTLIILIFQRKSKSFDRIIYFTNERFLYWRRSKYRQKLKYRNGIWNLLYELPYRSSLEKKIYMYLINISFHIFVSYLLWYSLVWNRISFFPTLKIYFFSMIFFFYRRRKSRSLITRKKTSNFFSESVHLSKKVLCNFLFAHHFRQSDSLNLINQPSESIRCLLRSNIGRIETTLAELFDSIDHEKLATTRPNFILYRGSTLSYLR